MPTPKQVRYHFKRISTLRYRLQHALNDAHNAGVIAYQDYQTQSPCKTLFDTWDRINATTEKQLAEAMRKEIVSG